MIACESSKGRRIVGRLDRGQSLLEALGQICRQHHVRAGGLRAIGSLEAAELASFDQDGKRWRSRACRGRPAHNDLVNLEGTISEQAGQLAVFARATLTRERDTGLEILGGHVVSARVFALEFVIDAFDDVILRRTPDPATGLSQWSEAISLDPASDSRPEAKLDAKSETKPAVKAKPAPEPEPDADVDPDADPDLHARHAAPLRAPSSTNTTWAQVAVASAKAEPEPDLGEADNEDSLGPGDVLIHPTFGRCEVQRIEGSYEYAHIRLKNNRLVRVSLDVLKVFPAGTEGTRRVFKARVA